MKAAFPASGPRHPCGCSGPALGCQGGSTARGVTLTAGPWEEDDDPPAPWIIASWNGMGWDGPRTSLGLILRRCPKPLLHHLHLEYHELKAAQRQSKTPARWKWLCCLELRAPRFKAEGRVCRERYYLSFHQVTQVGEEKNNRNISETQALLPI